MEEAALEKLEWADGILVGQLTEDELECFDYLCEKSKASRVYEGGLGLMGLAKVKIHR